MSKHTPGPWTPLWAPLTDAAVAVVSNDKTETVVVDTRRGAPNISRADALLMAAAPELLEALEALLRPTYTAEDVSRAVMAVLKAKGEA
jgi:hypothetical protein